jgi:ABC-type amino acid transport substrate-binding protein
MLTRCLLVALCIALMGATLSTATAQEVIAVDVQVAPHVLALRSSGVWVTIHTDIALSQVDTCAVEIDGADVPVARTKADSLGNLVVKVKQSEVKALFADLESPVRATVVLTGLTNDGDSFEGSDTIRVRP